MGGFAERDEPTHHPGPSTLVGSPKLISGVGRRPSSPVVKKQLAAVRFQNAELWSPLRSSNVGQLSELRNVLQTISRQFLRNTEVQESLTHVLIHASSGSGEGRKERGGIQSASHRQISSSLPIILNIIHLLWRRLPGATT